MWEPGVQSGNSGQFETPHYYHLDMAWMSGVVKQQRQILGRSDGWRSGVVSGEQWRSVWQQDLCVLSSMIVVDERRDSVRCRARSLGRLMFCALWRLTGKKAAV